MPTIPVLLATAPAFQPANNAPLGGGCFISISVMSELKSVTRKNAPPASVVDGPDVVPPQVLD